MTMGQANQRGNYEQRKSDAIERNKQAKLKRELERKHRRPAGKSHLGMLMAMALAASIDQAKDE